MTLAVSLDDNNDYMDKDIIDWIAEVNHEKSIGNNFQSKPNSFCSCCRLKNELDIADENELNSVGKINSFGAASGLSVGSHRVCGINLPRLAIKEKENPNILNEIMDSVHKILYAHRQLIKERISLGVLPLYNTGFMDLDRQYSTVGLIGGYEYVKNKGLSILTEEGTNALMDVMKSVEAKIKESNRIIELYNEQIDSKNKAPDSSGIETFRNMVVETQKTIDEVKTKIETLERSIGKMNICEHILGEYGVRAYIVNKLLDVFNNRIQYYLNAIKSTFNFRFNEYFEEEIKDSNGIICLYSNCSGAEMKKIDLAISFAINDMITLQKQVTYNVVFFDEILDSSVDDKSLNIILNFISEHTQNENKAVYIISHKTGAQIPFTNEVITLEKINGFTKRIIE